MCFSCLGKAEGAGRTSEELLPHQMVPWEDWRLCLDLGSSSSLCDSRREPRARRQALWVLAQCCFCDSPRFCQATGGAWPSPHTRGRPQRRSSCPTCTYHPLHLLGHLVAPQVIVEGTLSSPVGWVVPDGVGSLAIHLGNHGLFFFLQK